MVEIKRVLFIGSKMAGLECVKKMHEIAPDKLVGITTIDDSEDSRSEFEAFLKFAKEKKIPLTTPASKEESELLIKDFNPDLCVVSGWYWIFSKQILDSVPFGFIGFHNSILPKYRGGSPLVWQIINGEDVCGVSLFSITEEMDAGKIWAQAKFRIDSQTTIGDATKAASKNAVNILEHNYQNILNGDLIPKPQKGIPTYCAMRTPRDGKIDWRKSANLIYDLIRAQTHPYPGAFFQYETIKGIYVIPEIAFVWESTPVDIPYYGQPGQVVKSIKNVGVWVICGDNRPILITKVNSDQTADKIIKSGTRLG